MADSAAGRTTVSVREVRPEDHDAVAELTLTAYDRGGFVARTDPYAERLADIAHRAADARTWVVVDDDTGSVLGAVTYCPRGSTYREIAVDDSEAELRMLAVDPAARGRGAGRALVQRCIDEARADGHRRIVLSSMGSMTEAGRLYDRLGFVPLPERDWAPHDTTTEVTLLARVKEL